MSLISVLLDCVCYKNQKLRHLLHYYESVHLVLLTYIPCTLWLEESVQFVMFFHGLAFMLFYTDLRSQIYTSVACYAINELLTKPVAYNQGYSAAGILVSIVFVWLFFILTSCLGMLALMIARLQERRTR